MVVEQVVNGPAYRGLPRPKDTWIIQDLIPTGGLGSLQSPPKLGKSYLALQLAEAISSGEREWLTFPVTTHGPVYFLQLDTPQSLWLARLDRLVDEEGFDDSGIYFADRKTAPEGFDILKPEHQTWLHAQIQASGAILVVIDTIREAHNANENDSGEMKMVMNMLVRACDPAAVLLIAHPRKANLNIPQEIRDEDMDDIRGGYLRGRTDFNLKLTEKRLHYEGREARATLKIKRLDNGLWGVDVGEWERHLETVANDTTLASLREKARQLAALTGKAEEACRTALRRYAKRH